ncbi:hypothetical protein TCAL_09129 [Tigriopus californicus]|uniref:Uncharacterized protein n=1 Tax=Tigriopus californicus TaxID=6832 RepID=A0A553P6I9_TIGCA|nr:hypothetical protein TCAL_09129 [Tigriopus californicus]|eukprot:TCALIF_09129-PA protein Name:"Protein of unknown function" AED:0.07 eAED:0.07 QI:15/1/0.5/1/1/1/2/283/47
MAGVVPPTGLVGVGTLRSATTKMCSTSGAQVHIHLALLLSLLLIAPV